MSEMQASRHHHDCRQKARLQGELSDFLELPARVQERMLGRILARNSRARAAFLDNVDVLREVGIVLNYRAVIDAAERAKDNFEQ